MKAGNGLHTLLMKFLNSQLIKFLFVGCVNTLITYIVYLLLVNQFNYSIAYFVSYVVGIVVSYIFNTVYVFNSTFSIKKMLSYPFVYIIQYLFNQTILFLLIEYTFVNKFYAPLLVTVISVPVTFLATKKIIKRN